MMLNKEVEALGISFDFKPQYTIARIPHSYPCAKIFAFRHVYSLRQYIAKKLDIAETAITLVAISKNNKIVILCDNTQCRNELVQSFHPSFWGISQFYDNVSSESILKKLEEIFS